MSHKPKTRLYVNAPLSKGQTVTLDRSQTNYLRNTLRFGSGQSLAVFNGREGEWEATMQELGKKDAELHVGELLQPLQHCPDIWLVFAPVKNEKIDFLVRRAVELGVSRVLPVMTQHTIVRRINNERMQANIIEAAEQCGRNDLPELVDIQDFKRLLAEWPTDRTLLFCDEGGEGNPLKEILPTLPQGRYAVIIGPEGGFSTEERTMLKSAQGVKAISLGPRILRAETAALAALANIMAWLGDWEKPSTFTPAE